MLYSIAMSILFAVVPPNVTSKPDVPEPMVAHTNTQDKQNFKITDNTKIFVNNKQVDSLDKVPAGAKIVKLVVDKNDHSIIDLVKFESSK